MTRAPLLFEVPPATDAVRCRRCPAIVYWILTRKGKKMPVDCHAGAGCESPTRDRPGRGIAHHIDCVDAERFRRPRSPAVPERPR